MIITQKKPRFKIIIYFIALIILLTSGYARYPKRTREFLDNLMKGENL